MELALTIWLWLKIAGMVLGGVLIVSTILFVLWAQYDFDQWQRRRS